MTSTKGLFLTTSPPSHPQHTPLFFLPMDFLKKCFGTADETVPGYSGQSEQYIRRKQHTSSTNHGLLFYDINTCTSSYRIISQNNAVWVHMSGYQSAKIIAGKVNINYIQWVHFIYFSDSLLFRTSLTNALREWNLLRLYFFCKLKDFNVSILQETKIN